MIYQVFVYQLCFNFRLALIAAINGPANRLLAQIVVKNSAAETRTCFPVDFFFFLAPFSIKFRIIISFRKPCHMPFHKFIRPFTLTEHFSVVSTCPSIISIYSGQKGSLNSLTVFPSSFKRNFEKLLS